MKNFVLLLLLFISFAGKGQVQAIVLARQILTPKPIYIIDSVKIDDMYLNYIDPDEIASINVLKDAVKYPDGAVVIELKEKVLMPKLLRSKLLSLSEVSDQNVNAAEKQKPILYLLDGKLLTDTAGVRIPAICLNKVSIVKAAETEYFKTALPNVLIMMITTKALSNKPPSIILRGGAAANN